MKNSILFLLLISCFNLTAQKIFLDKYQEVAGLKVFQTVNNPNQYYYLSDQIQIGKDENGTSQVLFLKYSKKDASEAMQEDNTEGAGGGIFHALVNFQTPEEQVKAAEKALQEQNPNATIEGPITYKSGKVALISAIAGTSETKILGLVNAPTMEGNKTAVAFRLNKEDAKLLWETFKTPVPDISFAFEMEMEGFLSPRKVQLKGSFDKVYSSHEFGVSGAIPVKGIMLGADIGAAFEKMRNDGTIEVYQEEGGEADDEFLKIAYKQLAEVIFQRTDAIAQEEAGQDPLEQLLKYQHLLKGASEDKGEKKGDQDGKSSSPMPSIMATYKHRSVKQSGDFDINFNKVSAAQQFTAFAENIGQINCASCFREVNLDIVHKGFNQREILYMIDGPSEADFVSYINFVDVSFRKKHQSGAVEMDNKRIIRQAFAKNKNLFKIAYGYDKDIDYDQWMSYDYKTTWSFVGGYEVVEDWQSSTSGSVNLNPPFVKNIVKIEADKERLDELLVRAIVIRLYDIGGENKPKQLVLNREQSGQIEYVLPKDTSEYEYEVTWMLDDEDGTIIESGRKKSARPLLYVDRLPQK